MARVRIINLSPDSASIDVYHGSSAVASNLSYGTVTSYIPLTPGTSMMTIDVAGSKQVLSTSKTVLSVGAQYTLLINNSAATLQQVLLADQIPSGATSGPYVRFIHQALRNGPMDVYLVPAGQRLASLAPIVTNLAPGTTTGYVSTPTGVCTAVMLPAGTVPSAGTIPFHSGTQIKYEAGTARSLVLLDAQPSAIQALQVIATIDVEPAN